MLTVFAAFTSNAQTKPKPMLKTDTSMRISTDYGRYISHKDTVYTAHEKDITLLYQMLQMGYQGVATSDNFSKNQVSLYKNALLKVDSVFQPQFLKYHPKKTK